MKVTKHKPNHLKYMIWDLPRIVTVVKCCVFFYQFFISKLSSCCIFLLHLLIIISIVSLAEGWLSFLISIVIIDTFYEWKSFWEINLIGNNEWNSYGTDVRLWIWFKNKLSHILSDYKKKKNNTKCRNETLQTKRWFYQNVIVLNSPI